MNAMLLAAGRGTRLGKLGERTPKILVEIDGEPLLARQLRYLKGSGVQRVVLNAHHLADQVQAFVAALPEAADVEVVVEPKLLGTAGGVRNALDRLGDEAFAVLYGDVLCAEPIARVFDTHRRSGALATLTVYETTEIEGKGTVEVGPDGMVAAFHEKVASRATAVAFVNAGLYVVEPALIAPLAPGVALDFGHDVFPAALDRGVRIAVHRLAAPVLDIGTPTALELARSR